MAVLRDFRRAVDALERIATGLEFATRALADNAPSLERLQELERTRALWEADVEALLMKAEGKLKAAANSEARERTMRKSYEADLDPFDEESDESEMRVPDFDATAGEEEEVLPVRVAVAPESKKAVALRAKWA